MVLLGEIPEAAWRSDIFCLGRQRMQRPASALVRNVAPPIFFLGLVSSLAPDRLGRRNSCTERVDHAVKSVV